MNARDWWQLLEPYHAVVYFAPETRDEYAAIGLKGGWMGYFASRAAALGPVPAEVVIALFYNFHPSMVHRAIPDAWSFSAPEQVLEARRRVADAALRRALDDAITTPALAEAAGAARALAEAADPAGRPLFAAHASLAWPDEPHMIMWHAATLLREHRGDGHVATLLTHEVGPCEAHVLQAAVRKVDPATQRTYRGWSDQEWDAAVARLAARALVNAGGELLDEGRALLDLIESETDRLAEAPFATLGAVEAEKLARVLEDAGERIRDSASVPFPNPMGVTDRVR